MLEHICKKIYYWKSRRHGLNETRLVPTDSAATDSRVPLAHASLTLSSILRDAESVRVGPS